VADIKLDNSRFEPRRGLIGGLLSSDESPKEGRTRMLQETLVDVGKVFATDGENQSKNSIRSALEWSFESGCSDNSVFSFIQNCIALEAILGGDAPMDSLTQTLADRCAYLVSRKASARAVIRKEFKKLYRTRSKLVHGRSQSLSDEERRLMRFGKSMLYMAINKEIEYL
jgi:hypothetical protein